jgi:flagellum-specific peptidoglycan hydrolase FlgJ
VSKALEYYEIQHSDIVLAQSILETGHYRSKLCKENNNLFGLYNSKKKEYFKFTHWTESIEAYKNYIQYKYQGGDYYNFIDSIGYASDSLYVPKLKNIVKRYAAK